MIYFGKLNANSGIFKFKNCDKILKFNIGIIYILYIFLVFIQK